MGPAQPAAHRGDREPRRRGRGERRRPASSRSRSRSCTPTRGDDVDHRGHRARSGDDRAGADPRGRAARARVRRPDRTGPRSCSASASSTGAPATAGPTRCCGWPAGGCRPSRAGPTRSCRRSTSTTPRPRRWPRSACPTGIYNVVDDEPLTRRDYLAAFSRGVRARHSSGPLPAWVLRSVAGPVGGARSSRRSGCRTEQFRDDDRLEPRVPERTGGLGARGGAP